MHIPMRMCVACRSMKPKNELVRIVKTQDGIQQDTTGKLQCRGVYICPCTECVELGKKKKSLERAFKCAVDAGVYENIETNRCTDG